MVINTLFFCLFVSAILVDESNQKSKHELHSFEIKTELDNLLSKNFLYFSIRLGDIEVLPHRCTGSCSHPLLFNWSSLLQNEYW